MASQFQLFAVDDNQSTIFDIRKAAAKKKLPEVQGAVSEKEGLALISKFKRNKLPPVFIVDLQLSDDESGFRILQAIRRKPALRYAPVIILTSTEDQDTINRSYKLGATSYVIKEDNPKQFSKVLDDLIAYWSDASMHDRAMRKAQRAS